MPTISELTTSLANGSALLLLLGALVSQSQPNLWDKDTAALAHGEKVLGHHWYAIISHPNAKWAERIPIASTRGRISLTALPTYASNYYSQGFSQLLPVPDASVKCSGRWICIPVVVLGVGICKPVYMSSPTCQSSKESYMCIGERQLPFIWGKIQLRNLLAIASAFPLENKRESWRATGIQTRGTDYLEPDTWSD